MPRDSRSPSPHSPRGRSPTRRSRSRDRDRSYDKKPLSESQGSVSIFVRNLGPSTRKQDLQNAFEEFGNMRDVYIPCHYRSREPRGFAYIEFSNEKEANDAIKTMDGKTINGRQVTVTFAEGKRKTRHEMKMKSGGGYYGRRSRSPYDNRRRYGSYRRRRSHSRSYSRSPYRRSYSRSPHARYADRYSRRSRSRSASPPRKEARRSHSRTPPSARRRRSWATSPSRQKENNNGNHKEQENRVDNRGE